MAHFWGLVENSILPYVNNKIPYKPDLTSHNLNNFIPNLARFEGMHGFHVIKD
jgi:hypothetical protein